MKIAFRSAFGLTQLLRALRLPGALVLACSLAACGGSSSSPPAPVTVAFDPQPPGSLGIGTSIDLTAVVSHDQAAAGVNWSVACSSAACGTFTSATTASGSATKYTPPRAVPTGGTVTVTATSITDNTKAAVATITITPPASVLSDGTYIYRISGIDGRGPFHVVGALAVANGAITAGEQDFTDAANRYSNTLIAAGSSLSFAGGNIEIVLDTGNRAIGVGGVETLRGAMVSTSRVLISEFDSSASGIGSLDLQTRVAAPTGGYGFALLGLGPTNQVAIGGVLNFNGSALAVAGSVFDYNEGGAVRLAQTFESGTVTAPDLFGRVTFGLTPNVASGVPGFVLTGYIVSADRIELVENQPDALDAHLGGTALGQGQRTGTYTTPLGETLVHSSNGSGANGPLALAGMFSFTSRGAVLGELAFNDLRTVSRNQIPPVHVATEAIGRVTLSGLTIANPPASLNFQLYMGGDGAMMLGGDDSHVTVGRAYFQGPTPIGFSGTYALAGQGFSGPLSVPPWSAVGGVTVSAAPLGLSGKTDYNLNRATLPAAPLTGTASASSSLLNLTGLNSVDSTLADTFAFYPVDDTRVLAIGFDSSQQGLLMMEVATGPFDY